MASPFLLSLFFLITLSLSSTDSKNTITIPLSPSSKSKHTHPFQRLNHLTTSSINRAHHLKHPHKNSTTTSLTKSPLFPQSYGGYSISLGFGSPPQTLNFVMDTGSSLVWFPCTQRYQCTKCDFPNINSSNIPTFVPKLSSSLKIVGCKNPKCGLIFDPDQQPKCQDCDKSSGNCTQICPPYFIQYGSGSTTGLLLSETLNFPDKAVDNFLAGCSIFSTRQPSGIAGFGRGPLSLPEQMGLKKFSYCLVSHRFDDAPVSSNLILTSRSESGDPKTHSLSYTPFVKNMLTSNSAFQEYYYVSLRKITVGGQRVKIPFKFLQPGPTGDGGTIVDSGTTFTFMEREAFELVAKEFENQTAHYSRVADVEAKSGLRPCFNISGEKTVFLPQLVFHFKGGAKMELPLADYFSIFDDVNVVCMTIVTDGVLGPASSGGPAIILGNYQQQNFLLEFDLENERLGFKKQVCN